MTDDPGTAPLKRHWITIAEIQDEGPSVLTRVREAHMQGCTWFRVTEFPTGAWMEGWAEMPLTDNLPPTVPGP